MQLPDRPTPSQFIQSRTGQDAETILALLGDIIVLKATIAERDARIDELEKPRE